MGKNEDDVLPYALGVLVANFGIHKGILWLTTVYLKRQGTYD